MNYVHKVIWSKAQGAWIVVAEGTKAAKKAGGAAFKTMAALILIAPVAGQAATLPQGGAISMGQGTLLSNAPNEMVIKQTTDKLSINWQSFNVSADSHVIFDQPGRHAIALNRVIGSDGSAILGKIDANGQVFLINPNGVMFGQDAQVNVGGLVASALSLSDADFAAGSYTFKANGSSGAVINLGALQASEGGYVAVLGRTVESQGVIKARLGTVAMTGGDSVALDFSGDGLINLQVARSAVDVLVSNHGLIQSDGGTVLMTARSSNKLTQTVVNNDGVIQAQTLGERNGKIFLDGGVDDGAVRVAGTLDSRALASGTGGFIETSGRTVIVERNAAVTTKAQSGSYGTWLIDPTDFTIVSGGSALTPSGIGADTLMTSLSSSNVTLVAGSLGAEAGDIHVNSDISWSSDTKLTLTAAGTVHVNANINVNGSNGALALDHGTNTYATIADGKSITLAGSSSKYFENGKDVILIRTLDDLKQLDDSSNAGRTLALANDLDAADTVNWNGGLGYSPAAMNGAFYGHLNGLGHSVNNLHINRPGQDNVGLMGKMEDARVYNISVNGSIIGRNNVGLLAGASANSALRNIHTGGSVTGRNNVGGLAGYLRAGSAARINSSASVSGSYAVGGILGSLVRKPREAFVGYHMDSTMFSAGPGYDFSFTSGQLGMLDIPANVALEDAMGVASSVTTISTKPRVAMMQDAVAMVGYRMVNLGIKPPEEESMEERL